MARLKAAVRFTIRLRSAAATPSLLQKMTPAYKPATFYYTDAITDNALKFLDEHGRESREQPFFLYVAYTAAHWPMHALPEDIARYRGAYDAGYDAIRAARFDRAKKLGVIDAQSELSPAAESWEKVADKAWEARCMEVYAAMVDRNGPWHRAARRGLERKR
jgi:arylsulfatase